MANEAKNKTPKKIKIDTNENITANGAVSFPPPVVEASGHVDKLIGSSLLNLHKLLFHLVDEGRNILIVGERGTGKELAVEFFAEMNKFEETIEENELAAINCAATSDEFLESKLFGHVKGAYTGANSDRKGYIRRYYGKRIIFLDEIGDASRHFQALLLRYLETGDFSPLGSDEIKKDYKAIIISATSKPDKLREDLRDRFVSVAIPPLRDRKGDIPGLIKHLWDNESEKDKNKRPIYISYDVLKLFENYPWQGNVRELKKYLHVSEILCKIRDGNVLRTIDFPLLTGRSIKKDNSRKRIIANLKSEGGVKSITEFFQVPENRNHDIENDDIGRVEQMPFEPSFEHVLPDKYKTAFWEHHAKNGRGGAEMARMFGINKSTANKQIQKAKERLSSNNEIL